MNYSFISPGKYIQGPNVLAELGSRCDTLGEHALILISNGGWERLGDTISESFAKASAEFERVPFGGECTEKAIQEAMEKAKECGCDVIVGIGGGKTIDTARAAADILKMPMISCPTIAATDAPTSALAIIYTEDGVFVESKGLRRNPDIVLVDSAIIAASPVRLTVSGMGDGLATYYEARACYAHEAANSAGGISTITAMAIATACRDTILENGYKAKLALEEGALTRSVEAIIEANTLMSGLGFENAGLAAAHSINNGLSAVEECHAMYHGEKVAFGIITQLILENAPEEELYEVIDFCRAVGLPVSLEELGVTEDKKEKAWIVAQAACGEGEVGFNMPMEITPERYYNAILAADAIGRDA